MFSFSNENVALKSDEWTIMILLLIHLYAFMTFFICYLLNLFFLYFRLTRKSPIILSHLKESKIVQSLLKTLNLSSDFILNTIKYLLEHPLESQESSKSITNFEEID